MEDYYRALDMPTNLRELGLEVTDEQMNASGTLYNEKGMVYEDPQTGKLYLLTEEEE